MGGSSASLNQQNQTQTGFRQERGNLNSQIGLQQIGRQDSALQSIQGLLSQKQGVYGQAQGVDQYRAGLLGQRAGVEEGRLGQLTSGLENLTIGEQLRIAALAAKNAGK